MKTKTPDTAPVQFSGDGEIIVGTWSEGVGLRIRSAAGTVIVRLAQMAAIDLANQIMYAVDIEDDGVPVIGEPPSSECHDPACGLTDPAVIHVGH